jgi:uncharacterized membrane protein
VCVGIFDDLKGSRVEWFFMAVSVVFVVLFVKTHKLKASNGQFQEQLEKLAARLTQLERDLRASQPAATKGSLASKPEAKASPITPEQTPVPDPHTEAELNKLVEAVSAIYYSAPPHEPPADASSSPPSLSIAEKAPPVEAPDVLKIEPVAQDVPTPDIRPDHRVDTSEAPAEKSATRPAPEPVSEPARAQTPEVDPTYRDWNYFQDTPPSGPVAPATSHEPNFLERAFAAGRDWLLGGNTILRVGVVLLFTGLAFLLRYASEQFVVPVEYRYIGVALSALALLLLGWRLRLKKPAYGLILQGTGIAVLYLTTFAAMRLHPLLSSGEALVILVAVTICSAILSVRQNALGLAAAAALGGFAAPILTSTGSGNHVALFSYFVLLNTGIVLIAWFKAWRILNLIGFVGTFGIGFAWGMRSYTPALFSGTEPFLVLFFLMYVGIGLLFTRRRLIEATDRPEADQRGAWLRWSIGRTDYLDGTLMFGPSLLGFGLQCAVISHIEFGMAFSALSLGLFYLALAFFLRGRAMSNQLSLLTETYLALGVIFGTLAIPLALDARWTSAAWAVEGAGVYWLGLRQSRRLARIFALLLMTISALTYLNGLRVGTDTLLAASPLGAAMLGAALLFSYRGLRGNPKAALMNGEERCLPMLALSGLAFLYLIAPLCFGLNLTAISWALAGVVTLFIGLRLASNTFLFCALAVQLLGGLMLLLDLRSGFDTLLSGFPFGAAALGAALLCSERILRRRLEDISSVWGKILPILATSGLAFLYLLAPLCFDLNPTVISWAVAGLVTLLIGLRLASRTFLLCAFGVQLLGGLLFLLNLRPGAEGDVLDSGWNGLLCASFMGLALIASTVLAQRDARARENRPLLTGLGVALLSGLALVNLAALFVLDWIHASAAWAASGLLILWLGLLLRQRAAFYFGLFLEAAAGMAFLLYGADLSFYVAPEEMVPLAHFGFWTPAALSLAALLGAWRLWRVANRARALSEPFGASQLSTLSNLLLVWGVGWWTWATVSEAARFSVPEQIDHIVLLALSLSAVVWMLPACREKWRALALACLLPLVTAALVVLRDGGSLLAPLGVWAWPLFFVAHFLLLRRLAALLPEWVLNAAHVLGVWLLLGVLSLSAHDALIALSEAENAWRWLGWALAPSLYLLLMGHDRHRFWPVVAFPRAYRLYAALPVAIGLMVWFWLANLLSHGASAPLPYLPLVNPLELGLLIVLVAVCRWSLRRLPELTLPASILTHGVQVLGGVSLLALLTLAVCRAAHHWGGVSFHPDALLASMVVQAGLSLVWTLYALALMIGGNRFGRRSTWVAGAALVGVVVVKLFFVELGNSGSLARIVSFIGVGVLLLIVGYFSPLPPRAQALREPKES